MGYETFEFEGETKEDARNKAREGIPKGLTIVSERVLRDTNRRYIAVEGACENDARDLAKQHLDNDSRIETISLTVPARKGFLGIGKRQNSYSVAIVQKARISVSAAEVSDAIRPLCDSLLGATRLYEIEDIVKRIADTQDPTGVAPILCTINRFEDRGRDSDIDSLRIKCAKALRKLNAHAKLVFQPWCFLCLAAMRKVEIRTNHESFGEVQCPNCREAYHYSIKEFDEHLYLEIERVSVRINDGRASRNQYGPVAAELT